VNNFQPSVPYLLFHPKFIVKQGGRSWDNWMYEGVYALGWFRAACFAIDVQCRQFPLLNVVSHGRAWTVWNLPLLRSDWKLRIEYVFGEPIQLTFDEARERFVEYVCAHHWWSATYETEVQFRARNAGYTSMLELTGSTGLCGKWPVAKRKRRKEFRGHNTN
jgi:hypothetical protein